MLVKKRWPAPDKWPVDFVKWHMAYRGQMPDKDDFTTLAAWSAWMTGRRLIRHRRRAGTKAWATIKKENDAWHV